LVWIAGCWNSSNNLLTSHHQRTIVDSPLFWIPVWRKRSRFVSMQPVCWRSRRIRWIFVWSCSELWSLFKYSWLKLKNLKPISSWCPFQGLFIQLYHSHADLIWPDGTFKFTLKRSVGIHDLSCWFCFIRASAVSDKNKSGEVSFLVNIIRREGVWSRFPQK
jgi:hypothetical protein